MSSVLKKFREDHSRDIKEIAAATRIKEAYLKSIENEQYDKLPIEVYARGYIKVYAKYLGVSCETALEPYEKYLETKAGSKGKKIGNLLTPPVNEVSESKKVSREEVESQRIYGSEKTDAAADTSEKEEAKAWYYKPGYIWKGLLLLAVLCVVVFELTTSDGTRKDAVKSNIPIQPQTQPVTMQADPAKLELLPAVAGKPEVPAVVDANPVQPPAAEPAARKKHVLIISATEKTWIQLLIDGTDKAEVMMNAGENLTYEASRSISGIVGNAGGVKMKFNGKLLPMGKRGEVIYLNLPENKPQDKASPSNSTKVKIEKAI
jgi:cytoskeletal protein RodZ